MVLTEAEAQEVNLLASKMLRPGKTYAKYSTYASSDAVKQELLKIWNRSGIQDVMAFQRQQSGTGGQYFATAASTPSIAIKQEVKKKESVIDILKEIQKGKIIQSQIPSSKDVYMGTQTIGKKTYKTYQDVNTGRTFIGGETSGDVGKLFESRGISSSRIPTERDTRVGVQEVEGETYDVYKTEKGEKFIGKQIQTEIFQRQISSFYRDGRK